MTIELRRMRRTGRLAGAVMLAGLGFAAPAMAQDAGGAERIPYPVDTVTLVTHSSPGGGSDVFLREMSRFLGQIIDANFVVENVSGGSGANAMAHMKAAATDGSVLYATTPTYVFTSLLSNVEASYADLEPVVNVFYDPQVIYTRADAPFTSMAEVLDKAKAGRSAWGAANPGSLERLTLENLKRLTGVDAAIVTSEGGGDTMINVLNGTLDVAIGEIQELRSQLDAKQVRLLAVASEERLEAFPDLPTLKEGGVDLVVRKFRGLAGPKNIAPEAVAAWEQAIPRLLENPEYKALYSASTLVPAFVPHAEYGPFTAAFADEQRKVLTEAGVIQ
ncbi:tripartite tricarboxylate transporter substrate binding protein [Antarcticirhabdus aurantiaca]|uniref:Tripartite tricarboxylate transporter substrate binding protein n=1 Tax=Antarcticirhabdus aurantiaca TaxID=2606717 RepID=A0ACD4NUU5_9HYPH|nr:tripartite tricarboxylate transporter substrate binding protein [Antarcticirhabdus aurantiaca]WAJ30629.1 tripartite tricarboxylate transporter substrate binding protein [Jeongeuplla avenae]